MPLPSPRESLTARLRAQLSSGSEATPERVLREVRRHNEIALGSGTELITDENATAQAVLHDLVGFGSIQDLLNDPEIEEIWINDDQGIFVARSGRSEWIPRPVSKSELRNLVERMLAHSGRRVDLARPFVDASLPDGSRLHVAIPDVTREFWSLNIRKFHHNVKTLPALVERDMLSPVAADFLQMSMRAGLTVMVTGPTHAGKTTLLSALLDAGQSHERVVTVEETFELSVSQRDHIALQCRPPNLEGEGEITLRRLVKEALRMRPDRLVVGEVREAESLDLLIALNSGIPGCASLHANSARDALVKLCTLPLLAGRNIDASFVVPTVANVVDLVVHCRMSDSGHRYVAEIVAPTGNVTDGIIEASVIFRSVRASAAGSMADRFPLSFTGAFPTRMSKFEGAGLDPSIVLRRAA